MVIEGALSLHIDRVYFATLILPIVASVIGARSVLVAKEDWLLPSILWTVLVAQIGGGKSPTLETLLKPLDSLESRSKLNESNANAGNMDKIFVSDQAVIPSQCHTAKVF